MNEFTATNGLTVRHEGPGVVILDVDGRRNRISGYDFLNRADMAALREFFQHERDAELGRWRWPENPDYVVYAPDEEGVAWSVNERTGAALMNTRALPLGFVDDHARAARAYFDAHPERKPWHDAKEGEVWLVRPTKAIGGGEYPAIFQAGAFRDHGGYWEAHDITDARRIWPEGDAS